MKNKKIIMSILDKLEKEFHQKQEEEVLNSAFYMNSQILGDREYDEPIDPNIKKDVKGLIDMLNELYEEKIHPSTATNQDLFDYIPLFCINGALIATRMNIVYEDYLKLTEIMMAVLGIIKEGV